MATAVGHQTTASGDQSFAGAEDAVASGVNSIAIGFAAALALIALVALRRDGAAIGPSGLRAARFAGLLTYPLSLLHNLVGVAFMRLLLEQVAPQGLAVASACAGAIALATLVHLFAKRPL
jgi:peptidoglycan/LPS O-acetylase OafA/YrhL